MIISTSTELTIYASPSGHEVLYKHSLLGTKGVLLNTKLYIL